LCAKGQLSQFFKLREGAGKKRGCSVKVEELYRFAWRMLAGYGVAEWRREDAAQELVLVGWKAMRNVGPERREVEVRSYVWRSMRNRLISLFREWRRVEREVLEEVEQGLEPVQEMGAMVREVLERLSEKERRYVESVLVEGGIRPAARVLGVSRSTLWDAFRTIRKRLRTM